MILDFTGKYEWHPWFAWRPVEIAHHKWAWLETVERKRYMWRWFYRAIE